MSYTTMYRVPVEGELEEYKEYRNSWGSAAFVWDCLTKRYLPHKITWMSGDMQELWDLWKRQDIPVEHRIVLMFTFDRVMVKRHDLKQLAEVMDFFEQDFHDKEVVCHLPAIANDLRVLADDPVCYAVCWQQTSVSDDVWSVRDESINDDYDRRGYDISKDEGHWFLFDELEKVAME